MWVPVRIDEVWLGVPVVAPPVVPEGSEFGAARYVVFVGQDPRRSFTLTFEYGDGASDSCYIPPGVGAYECRFSHLFPERGTPIAGHNWRVYQQVARVIETGRVGSSLTIHKC